MSDQPAITEAFLFLEEGADPAVDRIIKERELGATLFVFVPDGKAAAKVADELAAGGVQLIELYRNFGVTAAAQVIEAVDGRAPVGLAGYELAPAGAGTPIRNWATIFADDNADPAADRIERERNGQRTTIAAAPEADFPAVAARLVDAGAQAVELCGGSALTTAARVVAATGGRVPIGLVSWPFEAITGAAAYKASFEEGTLAAHASA